MHLKIECSVVHLWSPHWRERGDDRRRRGASWPASLKDTASERLSLKIKVSGSLGTALEVDLWPPHVHTQRGTHTYIIHTYSHTHSHTNIYAHTHRHTLASNYFWDSPSFSVTTMKEQEVTDLPFHAFVLYDHVHVPVTHLQISLLPSFHVETESYYITYLYYFIQQCIITPMQK